MKLILLALSGLLLLFGTNASPFTKDECARGPIYWCTDLKQAKECNAVTHCIQTVWETHKVEHVDNDSVCKICLDMVQQARDQLRSNETQADLKAVFEGSCALLIVKPIKKECDKLADEFVPELVEALSSQMNPQVVCSVAGLCNNVAIDRMLASASLHGIATVREGPVKKIEKKGLSCNQCGKVSTLLADKFHSKSRDEVLENMLGVCRQFDSFSDACAAIVLTYFNDIYANMKETLTAENLCHMSGTCSARFHQHEPEFDGGIENEITPDFQIGSLKPVDDDIPCDLCKQLVEHLRDLLVANTTQAEFKEVLEGLCKQTKSFKKECLSIADEYYDIIYDRLTHDLDPSGACFLMGVCPKGINAMFNTPVQMMPLLPTKVFNEKRKILGTDEPIFSAQEVQSMQLPRDVLLLDPSQIEKHVLKKDSELCTLCEYFLHFVQETLASPKNEEAIKRAVHETCDKLPKTVQGQCQSFVDMYGDAVIALLIQDIDPSIICPMTGVCTRTSPKANEKCPLCLFLIQDLEDALKKDRSEDNIKNKLKILCDHFSPKLKAECVDFIETYTKELVEKIANDFSPQDICLYLKLCTPKEEIFIEHLGDKKSSNEYLSNTVYRIGEDESSENNSEENLEEVVSSPECILCERVIKQVEKRVKDNKSKEHIKQVLDEACHSLPKENLKNKCIEAVNKNIDYIIDAVIKEVSPKEICAVLGFCIGSEEIEFQMIPATVEQQLKDKPECVLCELIMTRLEAELKNKKTQEEIRRSVENICEKLPRSYAASCKSFIDKYADLIISMVDTVPPKELCGSLNFCVTNQVKDVSRNEITECAVCHAATEALAKYLKTNEVKDREFVIDRTCRLIPAKYYKRCNAFMGIYLESLEHLIEKYDNISDICVAVGMCYKNGDNSLFVELTDDHSEEQKIKPKAHLLGGSECTHGPSYWCSSLEAMEKCNARDFCLKKMQIANLP